MKMKDEYTLGEIWVDVLANVTPSESPDWIEITFTSEMDADGKRWPR